MIQTNCSKCGADLLLRDGYCVCNNCGEIYRCIDDEAEQPQEVIADEQVQETVPEETVIFQPVAPEAEEVSEENYHANDEEIAEFFKDEEIFEVDCDEAPEEISEETAVEEVFEELPQEPAVEDVTAEPEEVVEETPQEEPEYIQEETVQEDEPAYIPQPIVEDAPAKPEKKSKAILILFIFVVIFAILAIVVSVALKKAEDNLQAEDNEPKAIEEISVDDIKDVPEKVEEEITEEVPVEEEVVEEPAEEEKPAETPKTEEQASKPVEKPDIPKKTTPPKKNTTPAPVVTPEPEAEAPVVTPEEKPVVSYRIRKSADDADSQIGAFADLGRAKAYADAHAAEGYKVFDMQGNLIYAP